MDTTELTNSFKKIFETTSAPRIFFAPGRINLIGEHTDYNGGNVFPAAISFGTYALAAKRNDQKFRFYSLNFPETGIMGCDLSDLSYKVDDDWANFPKGMIDYLKNAGIDIETGIDILFYGNIPNGAGLSSSASIEMATGVLVENLYQHPINRIELIKIGQKVENEYIGVNSGIMDQFVIGKGRKDAAILLNCQTLNYEYVPVILQDYCILIINSNKRRTLAGSKYNERRSECESALSDLQKELTIENLGDLTPEGFESHKQLINSPIHRKRAKHAVYENARTLEARKNLNQHDLIAFGKLMNDSHSSLKDDYEVTGRELDTIVEAAWEHKDVIGARMTGAGFGGCAIALVKRDQVDNVTHHVNTIYRTKIGYDATFYTATISEGAREITEGI
ncbi:galactokinase [Virgibacillus subterraneus]|uniref:Galactokinase n=1 Tax=Virgibacillus subterraneus TaxID=621109 RepID=A0A1H9B1I1_9BACI|nr:galactokinase [Virgibacillus subterraneus]SEP82882.1 galactokinase [Virgibacillus subterraneus]